MILTDNEQKVIAAIELDADMAFTTLQKRSGLPAHTIRYTLNKLLEKKVLRYYPFINAYPLGYIPYSLFIKFSDVESSKKDLCIKFLLQHSSVSWVAKFSGDYDYCATILCRSIMELQKFLEDFGKLGGQFSHKIISTQTGLTLFPAKYIKGARGATPYVSWKSEQNTLEIDKVDRRILRSLVHEEYSSRRELGRILNIPSSTLDERLSNLIESGIIVRFVYLVNPLQIKYHAYKLLLTSKSLHPKIKMALFQYSKQQEFITTFIESFGDWDFELGIEISDQSRLQLLVKDFNDIFGAYISSAKLLTQLEELKVACYPFLE